MSQQTSAFDWQVVKTIVVHRAVSLYFKNNFLYISRIIFNTETGRQDFKNQNVFDNVFINV